MRPKQHGFTLIELLLALALTSLLTAALSVMIGQAARDRHAMQQQTHDPEWSTALIAVMERDLCQARWWAGSDDRVVLIGQNRDRLPAQIEYRWVETDSGGAWTREVKLLTDGPNQREPYARVLAIGLSGLEVGPHHFGSLVHSETQSQPAHAIDRGAPRLLINGEQVPFQPLPDRIAITLKQSNKDLPNIHRELLVR